VVSVEATWSPLALILLLFPHGHLPSRRWRPVVWATVLVPMVGAVSTAVSDVNFSNNFPNLTDPVRLLFPAAVSPVYGAFQFATLLLFLLGGASMVFRFRRSEGEERQQLKWFVFERRSAECYR